MLAGLGPTRDLWACPWKAQSSRREGITGHEILAGWSGYAWQKGTVGRERVKDGGPIGRPGPHLGGLPARTRVDCRLGLQGCLGLRDGLNLDWLPPEEPTVWKGEQEMGQSGPVTRCWEPATWSSGPLLCHCPEQSPQGPGGSGGLPAFCVQPHLLSFAGHSDHLDQAI